jgi:uncharacterized membrane protein YiaA
VFWYIVSFATYRTTDLVGLFHYIVGLFHYIVGLFYYIVGLFYYIVGLFYYIVGRPSSSTTLSQKFWKLEEVLETAPPSRYIYTYIHT